MSKATEMGITPAYAGKSRAATVTSSSATDHPRVCGEKFATRFESMFRPGSPPRMRGKVGPLHRRRLHPRITPAYAGKRLHGSCHAELTRDHPRVCGEKRRWQMFRQNR